MKKSLITLLGICLTMQVVPAQIKVNPSGVNVNASGATTVFLTFGRLAGQVPVEAFWCGELVGAAPDLGSKCDPGTLFGRLPIRYDLSRVNPNGTFTDIMSIPPSVARRAYQAAEQGATSTFFYVRRFVNTAGGPDEYTAVTCRLTGGGARVPFSLLDVTLTAGTKKPVTFVETGGVVPSLSAEIYHNGTGQLRGRWEVVLPGEEPPTSYDLLTESSLPIEQRGTQRRYTEVGRFNVFLPPTGQYTLPGPDVERLPTTLNGMHMILLRIEASADKEGDSNLSSVGAGDGLIHSGAVAGFPMPAFRYLVGNTESELLTPIADKLQLVSPVRKAMIDLTQPTDFSWISNAHSPIHRLEVRNSSGETVLTAVFQSDISTYRAPNWLKDQGTGSDLSWRICALNYAGDIVQRSDWQSFEFVEGSTGDK